QAGILHHLQTVEMPWVVTNARMVWRGVRIDAASCRRVEEACQRHLDALQPQLEALGVPNVRSHHQLEHFFAREGLLDLFRRAGKVSFDKELLDEFRERHPAIPLIRAARRAVVPTSRASVACSDRSSCPTRGAAWARWT